MIDPPRPNASQTFWVLVATIIVVTLILSAIVSWVPLTEGQKNWAAIGGYLLIVALILPLIVRDLLRMRRIAKSPRK